MHVDYYTRKLIRIILIVVVALLIQGITLYVWTESKKEVVVLNLNSEGYEENYSLYPMIDYMPSSGPYGAKLYYFLSEYVKWRFEETYIEYSKLQVSDEYSIDYIRRNIQNAMATSEGKEYDDLKELFVKSADRYREMKKVGYQKYFNIDAIDRIEYMPESRMIYVSVLGEFSISYDRSKFDRTTIPDEGVNGYVRIGFLIKQDKPLYNEAKGSSMNPYGFYVVETNVDYNVGYATQENLFKQRSVLGYNIDLNTSFKKRTPIVKEEKKK